MLDTNFSIQIFKNDQFGNIRAIDAEGRPMFIAYDIARALGYEKPRNAISTHCKSGDALKWGTVFVPHENGIGGTKMITIDESNVFRLIMRSCLPDAEKFQDWVCEEVLPEIRKHGGYMVASPEETEAELILRAMNVLQATVERQRIQLHEAQQVIEQQNPKVEFFDAVADSKHAVDMKTVAKTLNMGIGRNKLFEILRDKKVLDARNQPYQKYVDLGWFRLIETHYTRNDGESCISFKTVVFQKGVDGIRKILTNNQIN